MSLMRLSFHVLICHLYLSYCELKSFAHICPVFCGVEQAHSVVLLYLFLNFSFLSFGAIVNGTLKKVFSTFQLYRKMIQLCVC